MIDRSTWHCNIANKIIMCAVIIGLISINLSNFKYKSFIPGGALVLGMLLTAVHNDTNILRYTKLWSTKVLSYAIILLGFGFNLNNIIRAGVSGIGYTVISIGGTLILGISIGCLLKNESKISTLITVGTAICGGSAIAAIAPIIRSSHEETAVAMGVVFLLNAVGLLLFPFIGHQLALTQHQFGLLAALAIHDTSSVVGSCMIYGQESLAVGTTVKLVRALWIIPLSLVIAVIYSKGNKVKRSDTNKSKKPWFILWFIVASLLVTLFPQFTELGINLKKFGEAFFTVALFLIGYNVSLVNLKTIGAKVFFQAVSLWLIVSVVVIIALKTHFLSLTLI